MNSRDKNADIIRILAFISLISVHYIGNGGLYDQIVSGKKMYVIVVIRTFFLVCVPLFIMLTGYLQSQKQIELEPYQKCLGYFCKIKNVAVTYLLSTIILICFRVLYLKENITLKQSILNILSYQQYSWYVNMYLGLYFLIPLLNKLWLAVRQNKSERLVLLSVCTILTIAPSVFNIYDFSTDGALLSPWLSTNYTQIIPNWWVGFYPITFYFIGAEIKENKENIQRVKRLYLYGLLILSVLISGSFNYLRVYSTSFKGGVWCEWGSLQTTIISTLVFIIVISYNSKKSDGRFWPAALKKLSDLIFGAYILSWLPDVFLATEMNKMQIGFFKRMCLAPFGILFTFAISVFLAEVVYLVRSAVDLIYIKVTERGRK